MVQSPERAGKTDARRRVFRYSCRADHCLASGQACCQWPHTRKQGLTKREDTGVAGRKKGSETSPTEGSRLLPLAEDAVLLEERQLSEDESI